MPQLGQVQACMIYFYAEFGSNTTVYDIHVMSCPCATAIPQYWNTLLQIPSLESSLYLQVYNCPGLSYTHVYHVQYICLCPRATRWVVTIVY